MKRQAVHQQNPFDLTGLLPAKSWKVAVLHMLIMVAVVFFTEISSASADGLFDFQMKLAQKGNAEAQFKVGEMYETGFGVKQDREQARIWIDKAAAKGHVVAGYKLLYWDLEKQGIKDTNKAELENLKKMAAGSDGQAQYYVGKMYARGVGVKKNLTKGMELLNKAAFVGVLEAEREAISLREEVQRAQLAKRRAEQKRMAKLKAKQELNRQKKLQAQRKAAEAKKLAAEEKKLAADKETQQRREEADKKSAEQRAQEQEKRDQQRLVAERAALEKEREVRRQALLTQRKAREKNRKEQFESDPCSGKSARFLSTCR
jgi:flagellar biosynthesis GTPase FlhF